MLVHLYFIISFDILCFMHKVSWRNKKKINDFFNRSGHGLFGSGRVDRNKIELGQVFFGSGRVKKFWPVLPCLVRVHTAKSMPISTQR